VAKRNRMDVDEFFSQVDQTHEVYELRTRVQTLEQELNQTVDHEQQLVAEIEQLRMQSLDDSEHQQLQGQLDALREHLTQNQGTVQYPVSKIYPNPEQPRQSFTEEVEAMALSLQQEGQLDPVILFEDGMLFDGECRWRASKVLEWEMLEAVFTTRPKDQKTLRRHAYLTSLHRRGLNALDKAETLVAIACDEIQELLPEEVPRIINRVLIRLKRKQKKQSHSQSGLGERLHLQPTDQQQAVLAQLALETIETQVFAVFLSLQEHPTSLNRNVFPALNLLPDLKTAVREKGLSCPQALILNRLTAAELNISDKQALALRQQGVQEVLKKDLSTAKTQAWVTEQKALYLKPSKPVVRDEKVERALTTIREIDFSSTKASPEQLQELQEILEVALKQVRQKIF